VPAGKKEKKYEEEKIIFLAALKSLKKRVETDPLVRGTLLTRGSGSASKFHGSPTLVTFGKFVPVS
jgi:hypothetical protein